MNHRKVGRTATLMLAALTILAGLALPNGIGMPSALQVGETAPVEGGQDPWAVWSHKDYDPLHTLPFTRELFERHVAPIDNAWSSWDAYVASLDPAPDLQTQVLSFPNLDVRALVPARADADAQQQADLRRLGRAFVVDHLAQGSGLLATLFQSGAVHAVEFDWHHAEHMLPMPEATLPVVGAVFARTDSADVLLAYVYAYSEPQFIARRQELELNAGAPLVETQVFAAASVSAQNTIWFSGTETSVFGDVSARNKIHVEADGLTIAGAVSFGNKLVLEAMPTIDGPSQMVDPSQIALAPVTVSIDAAREAAQAGGMYSMETMVLTQAPPPGTVIFTEGDLHVHGWGWQGAYSFFARGSIFFEGGDAVLSAATGHALAVAYEGDVEVNTTNSVLSGLLAAPSGYCKLVGGDNHLHGPVTGVAVRIQGERNTISDGTSLPAENGGGAAQGQSAPMGGGGMSTPTVPNYMEETVEPAVEEFVESSEGAVEGLGDSGTLFDGKKVKITGQGKKK